MTSESLALFLLLIQVLPPGAVSNFSSSLFPSPSSPKCLCDFDFETQRWREIWDECCFFCTVCTVRSAKSDLSAISWG